MASIPEMEDLEARVARELKKHSDTDYAWGKWYCVCGSRLRKGFAELATHRQDVEQNLRDEVARG